VLVTLAAGVWIYWFTFQATSGGSGSGDTMGDHMGQPSDLVWLGLAALIAAQVYDAYRTTRACRVPTRPRVTDG
jgi:hypothetical protein